MARVSQFAKDLGINYNQAKSLINEGRSRKDGGSQVLEKTMKPIKAKDGKSVAKPKSYRKALREKAKRMDFDKNPKNMTKFLNEHKELVKRDIMEEYERLKKLYNTERRVKRPSVKSRNPQGGGEVPRQVPARKELPARKEPRRMMPKEKRMSKGGSNDLGMQSVKYGLDNNPAITAADPKAKFIAADKEKSPVKASKGRYQSKAGEFRGCGSQVKGKKFKGVF